MRARAAWLATALAGVGLLAAAAAFHSVLVADIQTAGYQQPPLWQIVPMALFLLVAPAVGALVAARTPRNAVGWLFLVVPSALAIGLASESYAVYFAHALDERQVAAAIAWVGDLVGGPAFVGFAVMALLFPDGRAPSRRWRPLLWLAGATALIFTASGVFRPGDLAPGVPNPVPLLPDDAVTALDLLSLFLVMALFIAAVVALVVRFRRAGPQERQQIKWFAYAVAITVALLTLATTLGSIVPLADFFWGAALSSLVLWPLAAGIAILRYRLYDIDLLINRTLVYGALSALLAATYFGAAVVLSAVLRPFAAESELAVAGSTLAVVILFAPLRSRIQRLVDERFYRSKYDAARTLDAFAARLRDQLDLDALEREMLGVVGQTVQPAHAALWLRERAR